jgi:hypothetical protein
MYISYGNSENLSKLHVLINCSVFLGYFEKLVFSKYNQIACQVKQGREGLDSDSNFTACTLFRHISFAFQGVS